MPAWSTQKCEGSAHKNKIHSIDRNRTKREYEIIEPTSKYPYGGCTVTLTERCANCEAERKFRPDYFWCDANETPQGLIARMQREDCGDFNTSGFWFGLLIVAAFLGGLYFFI
jgi:hypothetical protein